MGPPTGAPQDTPSYAPTMDQQPQQPGADGGAGGAEETFEERLARLKNM